LLVIIQYDFILSGGCIHTSKQPLISAAAAAAD
jgi:hypothetical protein